MKAENFVSRRLDKTDDFSAGEGCGKTENSAQAVLYCHCLGDVGGVDITVGDVEVVGVDARKGRIVKNRENNY